MEESTSREKILTKIRNALISKKDIPYPGIDQESPVFRSREEPPEIIFAETFNQNGGKFIYCDSYEEFVNGLGMLMEEKGWPEVFALDPTLTELLRLGNIPFITGNENLRKATVGLTPCEYLVARTGSVMISSAQVSGRKINIFPDVHIVLATTSQLVADIREAFIRMKKKYSAGMPSMISLITGPSRTADIEKTLVLGAHGPRELFLFLIEDQIQ